MISMDKQTVTDQVRKVLIRLKQNRRNDGFFDLMVHAFEYQVCQLEHLRDPFVFSNSISSYVKDYASRTSGEQQPDPPVTEVEKAGRMVQAFLEYSYIRRKKIRDTDSAYDRLYRNGSKELEITVDASKIGSYKDYIDIIQTELDFPRDCEGNIDRYLDWIRDLDWLPFESYVFTLTNSRDLECRNAPLLKEITDDFNDIIIPFWDHEAPDCIVGGTRKDVRLNLP